MPISLLLCLLVISGDAKTTPTCCGRGQPSAGSCPFCSLEVVKDTETVDNLVQLEKNGSKTAYPCVLCVLADVKADKGDVVIVAPSEKKGKPVTITRSAGKWTVNPETALFVYVKGSHAQCQVRYRAITSKDAFDAYVQSNPKILASAKPLTLEDLLKRAE